MSVGDQESICCLAPQYEQCEETAAPSAGKKGETKKRMKEAGRESLREVSRKMSPGCSASGSVLTWVLHYICISDAVWHFG